jgi:hypothetical protein
MCTFEENKELELEEKKNGYDFCYKPSNDLSEKPTGDKTSKFEIDFDKNKNVFSPKFVVTNEDTDTDDDSSINFYSYKKIQEIFAKKKNFTQIRQKFKKNGISAAEYKLCKTKRKREDKNKDNICNINEYTQEKNKSKRGRKTKMNENKDRAEHNKMSSDNIIKKIKSKLFLYLFQFLNKMLKKTENDKKPKLAKLDYKYINQLNKDIDIKYLRMPLKDLASLEISTKFKNRTSNSNQQFIKNVINKTEPVEDEDYDTILFVFNMTFREWLDLFTCKKDINMLKAQYTGVNIVNFDKIGKNIDFLRELLEDMIEKNGEKYFSFFTFYLYNYERWFSIKTARNKKSQSY